MRRAALLLLPLALAGCSRASRPSFPPPARPPVFIQLDFETAFASLSAILESRNFPLVVEDPQFGSVRTDWVYYEPGELDVRPLAECQGMEDAPPARVRARFGFDVRRRTVNSTVTILTQWQIERHPGMDTDDRSFVDCRSTGEWERLIEATLTQRGTIR
ncbi:MAG: hypothetical protein AMXMBFR53_28860 [Gemmatimonadota bacterium]